MRNLLNIFLLALLVMSLSNTTNAQWTAVGNAGFSASQVYNTSLAKDDSGTPYVAYRDGGNDYKATVMKYNSTTGSWEIVGGGPVSTDNSDYTSLAFDGSGTLYIAYQDNAVTKLTVMKYNSITDSWEAVGSPGFSAGVAEWISLDFDGSDTPYVAYTDEENGDEITVMKYNSTDDSWENVGTPAFSNGQSVYTSLAIDDSGAPHVTFREEGDAGENKAVVMKYDSSSDSWTYLGGGGFSPGQAQYPCLAFDNSGTPYVAFADDTRSRKAVVMKYNGSTWENVGNVAFSQGNAYYNNLVFDSSNTPYLAYSDWGNSRKATVMKLNGNTWEPVGTEGFSPSWSSWISLALDNSGTPYVAFEDQSTGKKATVMKYPPTETTWNGTAWSVEPNASLDAIIDANYTGAGFECDNLTINSGNTFTLNTGECLEVAGTLTDNGSGITLKDGASLISSTTGISGTVEKTLPGSVWNQVGSPVGSITKSTALGTGLAYSYFEAATTQDAAWIVLGAGDNLVPGQGYIFKPDASGIKNFAGTFNAGSFAAGSEFPELKAENADGTRNGFNLIANPFPSNIDWEASTGWDKSGLVNPGATTIWVWNNGTSSYDTYAVGGDQLGTKATRLIPPGTAFFVRVATTGGTLSMSDAVKACSVTKKKTAEETENYLKLRVNGNDLYDEMIIRQADQAVDIAKMMTWNDKMPQIYIQGNEENIAIRRITEFAPGSSVQLGFECATSGTYSFSPVICTLSDDISAFLEDTETKDMVEVTSDFSYSFTWNKDENPNRFVLHFNKKSVTSKQTLAGKAINIYSSAKTAYLYVPVRNANVTIYNLNGQQILQQELNADLTSIEIPQSGVYVVKVKAAGETVNQKIIIQ